MILSYWYSFFLKFLYKVISSTIKSNSNTCCAIMIKHIDTPKLKLTKHKIQIKLPVSKRIEYTIPCSNLSWYNTGILPGDFNFYGLLHRKNWKHKNQIASFQLFFLYSSKINNRCTVYWSQLSLD